MYTGQHPTPSSTTGNLQALMTLHLQPSYAGCGHVNPRDAHFCGECGVPLQAERPCPTCGRMNPVGLKFCRGCGSRLSAQTSVALASDGQPFLSSPVKEVSPQTQRTRTTEPLSSSIPSIRHLTPCTVAQHSLFHCDGEYWTLVFQGTECRLKHNRGLQYLAHLLSNPHQEVHAIALVSGGNVVQDDSSNPQATDLLATGTRITDLGDAGDILDPQAKVAYKRRLQELHKELEEAREFNDLGRIEKLTAESEFLTRELTRAVGFGGRQRRAGSATERARANVTMAIKATLSKIIHHHPQLGKHLTCTIKTGTFCSYSPDPRVPVEWTI